MIKKILFLLKITAPAARCVGKKVIKNYKTTIPALFIFMATLLYWLNVITGEQLTVGVAALSVIIGAGSRDI